MKQVKIVVFVPESHADKAKEVIKAMKKVHPYDEVAFDIYPLIGKEEL